MPIYGIPDVNFNVNCLLFIVAYRKLWSRVPALDKQKLPAKISQKLEF